MTAQTDRELLEAAARAAGVKYDPEKSRPHPKSGAFWGLWLDLDGEPTEYQRRHWNPLHDDGDALRLAVRLGLVVCVLLEIHRTGVYLPAEHIGGKYDVLEEHNGDPYAATRRAITRAAAAIGTHKEVA